MARNMAVTINVTKASLKKLAGYNAFPYNAEIQAMQKQASTLLQTMTAEMQAYYD